MTDIQLAAKSLNEFHEKLDKLSRSDADLKVFYLKTIELMIDYQPEVAACVIAKGVGE